MVLTVTLNPLLERINYFKKVAAGKVNRSLRLEFKAGGKGINISRQLNKLGIENHALTFLGGSTGKQIRHLLTGEGINFSFISVKEESRTASIIRDEFSGTLSSYFDPDPQISESEAAEFMNRLEKMIQNCSVVVFSGSSPSLFTDLIIPFGIETANKYDKISVLDTYGAHLPASVDKAPTVLHNNCEEIKKSYGIPVKNENDKFRFLDFLYSKGIKIAYLSDGAKPVFASKFDFHYKLFPPEIKEVDATGSGDAFTAGVIYGLEKSMVFKDFSKFAAALGALNASSFEVCEADPSEAAELIPNTVLKEVGKKMKLIDDTPNS